jgi:hypothetical protein
VRRWIGFAPRDDGQYHDDLCDLMRRHIIIYPINPPEVLKVIGGGNLCRTIPSPSGKRSRSLSESSQADGSDWVFNVFAEVLVLLLEIMMSGTS